MTLTSRTKIKYSKSPLSIESQITKLRSRGLIIDNNDLTSNYLSNISYYRLRAYTFPFQNNTDEEEDHHFLQNNIHFKDIIDLYCFDRRLRNLIFNEIEKIEVAVRTKIIQKYSESTNDSHWFENESLFKDDSYIKTNKSGEKEKIFKYNKLLEEIQSEIHRSNEDFIKHYQNKYKVPDMPPSWMTLEVVSFGTLSRLYELLKKDAHKIDIAKEFGLNKIDIMENWLHAISILRNCCAHHSRIWNRRFIVSILFPYNTLMPFIDRNTINTTRQNKLFAFLCCIKYTTDIISPGNDFKKNLISLIENGGKLLSMKEMGFPDNWKAIGIWKDR